MHSNTKQAAADTNDPCRFSYPKKAWRFPMLCGLLFVALLGVSYGPYCISGKLFVISVVGLCALALAAVVSLLGDWSHWLKRHPEIVLTDEGITVYRARTGQRSLKWEEIRRIRSCGGTVEIELRKGSLWKGLVLRAWPFVFRDIVPAILQHRGDLKISKCTQRGLSDPERLTRLRREWATVGLSISTVLLVLALWPELVGLDDPHRIVIVYGLIVFSFFAAQLPSFAADKKQGFLRAVLLVPMIVGFAFPLHVISEAPRHSLYMMVAAGATMTLLGFLVVLTPAALSRLAQAMILCLLAGIPASIFVYGRATAWPRQDVSNLLPACSSVVCWNRSGTYLAPVLASDLQHVVEFPSLTPRPIPRYPDGRSRVCWFGDDRLVRTVITYGLSDSNESDDDKLLVYDFHQERETVLPSIGRFLRPRVSPDGRYVAWLNELPSSDPDYYAPSEIQLCIYDLQKEQWMIQSFPLPDYTHVDWEDVCWQEGESVIVTGESRIPRESEERTTAIHLFTLELRTMQTEVFTCDAEIPLLVLIAQWSASFRRVPGRRLQRFEGLLLCGSEHRKRYTIAAWACASLAT